MTNSVYKVNKGINKSIEFKGLKAQYIWYLGGAMLGLLALFAIMYIIGINTYICLMLILAAGTASFMYVYKLSNTYGEFGMMKKAASQGVPAVIKSRSRWLFRSIGKGDKYSFQ